MAIKQLEMLMEKEGTANATLIYPIIGSIKIII